MKKILLCALIAALLFGCSDTPSSKTYGTATEHKGYRPGPTPQDPVVEIIDTTVLIKPTWGQAFGYAKKGGWKPVWTFLFIALAGYVIFRGARDEPLLKIGGFKIDPQAGVKGGGVVISIIVVVFLGLAFTTLNRPADVRWNNDKYVPKSQVDRTPGNLKPVWDSMESRCLIIGGPINCYK